MAILGSLILQMGANVRPMLGGLAQGESAIARLAGKASSLSLGKLMVAGGTAAAIKQVVGQAIDMETAMVGLSKAADLDSAAAAVMKGQLQSLSTELKGVPIESLLEIATSGAKMGVASNDLLAYTEGIAKVSTAMDDIPASVVADQIGKMNSVFKLGTQGSLQIGSAIDKLADSGVSSASGILEVTQRLSGTAAAMGLGVPETTAMAAALLDTGTQSELAASSIGRLLQSMVETGNHAAFAKQLGVPIEAFAAMVKDKPIAAVQGFLGSLRTLDAGSQLKVLGNIGVDGAVAGAEIQKLAQQTDSLTRYINLASSEFQTLDQVNKSYAASSSTSNAAIVTATNHFKSVADTIGGMFLPALNSGLAAFGSLASGYNAFLKGTLLPGFEAIGARLAEFPATLAAVFGSGTTEMFTAFATTLKTTVLDAAAMIGKVWRNLPDYFDVAALYITEKVLNLGARFEAFTTNVGRLGQWLANNWSNLIIDGVNAVGTAFRNLGTNISGIWDGLKSLAAGKGFQFEWTPILQGFEATLAELPAMVDPAFISLQGAIKEKLADIDAKDAALRSPTAAALNAPASIAPTRPAAVEEFAKTSVAAAAEYHATAAVEFGSKEASSAVARFRNGGAGDDKPAKETAKNTRDSLNEQRRQTVALEKIANQNMANGQGGFSAFAIGT